MNEVYLNVVFLFEVFGHVFGTIHGAMLPARTTERHLEMREIALDETLDVRVRKRIDALQEREYLTILLQKINYRLVDTRERLILLVLTRVVRPAAVKDITSAISGMVFRKTAFKRERVNRD